MEARGTEGDLLNDLQAPIKSFRIFALEQIIRGEPSLGILKALEGRKSFEDDDECKLLLQHAISAIGARLSKEEKPGPGIDPETFPEQFFSRPTPERLKILFQLSPPLMQNLCRWAPDLLARELDPTVTAALIKTFARKWPKDRLADITSKLFSESLSIRLAVLEALIEVSPQSLEKFLPRLLVSEDPRTRILAIRGLIKLDPEEGIAHLDVLLASPERHHKEAAIRNCFFFPFEKAKGPILKFLALEKDQDLLEKAGALFEVNPDLEVPFRLAEIAEGSPVPKSQIVHAIMRNSLKIIQQTRILGDNFENYRQKFEQWTTRIKASKFVQAVLSKMEEQELDPDIEWKTQFSQAIRRPEIREELRRALNWEISEAKKDRIRKFLEQLAPEESPVGPQRAGWETLTIEEKIRFIASIQLPQPMEEIQFLETLCQSDLTPADLKATAIRSALRCHVKTLIPACEKLTRTPDANLASAALEYLGAFSPENLLPHLGAFLQSTNPRIKSTALRILQKLDPAQAISTFKAMLKGINPTQRDLALSLMMYFDFSLMRDILCEFMENHAEPKYLDAGLCFFQANPDPENLYPLYKIQKSFPGEPAVKIKAVRAHTVELLLWMGKMNAASAAALETDLERRWQKDLEKRKSVVPAYSVKKLFPESPSALAGVMMQLREISHPHHPMVPGVLCLVIAVLLGTLFLGEEKRAFPEIVENQLPAVETKVQGSIGEVFDQGESALVQAEKQETYLILAKKREFSSCKPGETLKMLITPVRKRGDGAVVASLERLIH